MSKCKTFLCSSVGKKFLVAITGVGLSLFTLVHMSGNLLLIAGPEIYNYYSHQLISNPAIYVAEIGLLILFLIHLSLALKLQWTNRVAQGHTPSQKPQGTKASNFGSRSMALTGLLILVFTVLHLITFKFGTYYETEQNGVKMRDLYRLVAEKFSDPAFTAFYVFCMCVLFVHLTHGIAGLFQSLGVASRRNSLLQKVGYLFAMVVAGGFIVEPLYMYFFGGK